MRALWAALVVALGAAVASHAATKPSGGKCECGDYIEAPALCRSLPVDKREQCNRSNDSWFDNCVAWQEQTCTSGVTGTVAKTVKLSAPASLVPAYAGTWRGRTICPRQGTWNIMLSIRQQPDGSYLAKAATEGMGEFKKLTLTKNGIVLLHSTVFKDTSYVGGFATADRLQGTVKIQEDCTWYLTKSP